MHGCRPHQVAQFLPDSQPRGQQVQVIKALQIFMPMRLQTQTSEHIPHRMSVATEYNYHTVSSIPGFLGWKLRGYLLCTKV